MAGQGKRFRQGSPYPRNVYARNVETDVGDETSYVTNSFASNTNATHTVPPISPVAPSPSPSTRSGLPIDQPLVSNIHAGPSITTMSPGSGTGSPGLNVIQRPSVTGRNSCVVNPHYNPAAAWGNPNSNPGSVFSGPGISFNIQSRNTSLYFFGRPESQDFANFMNSRRSSK